MSTARGLPRSARLLIGATAIGGAAGIALRLPEVSTWASEEILVFAAIMAIHAITEQFQIQIRHGAETENFSIGEALWTAALLLTSPAVLTLALGIGVLIGQVARRWAPSRIAFNVGQHLIGITLAQIVIGEFGPLDVLAPRAWLAAALAMGVYFLVNEVSVALIISLAAGKRFLDVLLPSFSLSLLHWAGNVALGILGAVVWTADPLGLPLLIVPLVLSYLAYRGWLRTLQQRDRMNEMARIADTISSQGDLTKRVEEPESQDEIGLLAATLNRMLDRLESAFEREHRFISEASHELRSPITICLGYLDAMKETSNAAEAREAMTVVEDELGRMIRIVEDMTMLARMDHPEYLRPEAVRLNRFMADVAAKALHLVKGEFRIGRVPTDVVIRADPQRLTQALINLLQNAALHSERGSEVHLRVVPENEGWRFEVEDRGGGLSSEEEESVFRPFFRGRTTAPGSGLGLAVVQKIAEAHGGAAGVENHRGLGATFWVRVPR